MTRRRKSLFSNTLVLPGVRCARSREDRRFKKLDSVKHTSVLRGRHLEGAIFNSLICARPIWRAPSFRARRSSHAASGRVARPRAASGRVARFTRASGRDALQCAASGRVARSAQLQGASLVARSFRARRSQGAASGRVALWRAASGRVARMSAASGRVARRRAASGRVARGAQLQGADFRSSSVRKRFLPARI